MITIVAASVNSTMTGYKVRRVSPKAHKTFKFYGSTLTEIRLGK